MKEDIVSIIIPVFNVEEYLDKCIESVVKQTYNNLEIILINDGSTDNSLEICKKWKEKDSRIKLINKKNSGLGLTRNTGLDNANGKYVLFLDSDDFLNIDAIEKLYSKTNVADTVFAGYINYYSENNQNIIKSVYSNCLFKENQIIEKVLLYMIGNTVEANNDITVPMSVNRALYSMDIIKNNNIRFFSERKYISEDIFFNIDYLTKSKSLYYIEESVFYYRKNNSQSLTSIYNPERFDKEIILYRELERRMSEIMEKEKYISRLQRTFLGRIRTCIKHAEKHKVNVNEEILKICSNEVVQQVLKEYPYWKGNFKLRLFNICIKYKIVILLRIMVTVKHN